MLASSWGGQSPWAHDSVQEDRGAVGDVARRDRSFVASVPLARSWAIWKDGASVLV